jgi:hypothetical protein
VNAEERHWLADHTIAVLTAAMNDDRKRCALTLAKVDHRLGSLGVFGVCYAMAGVVLKGIGAERGEGFALKIDGWPDPEQAAQVHAGDVWAWRFITAYANRDKDMLQALFDALPEDVRFVQAVGALVSIAGRVTVEAIAASGPSAFRAD